MQELESSPMSQATAHATRATFAAHGALGLAAVEIDAYNAELRDAEGFIGDRASNRAFRAILEDWRERLRKVSDDPLGSVRSDEISKKKLDKVLAEGEPEAAGVVHGAIEDFAKELATVVSRFLRMKEWKGTQRIVVGGGLRASRVGELAIGRASVMMKSDGHAIDLLPISHHPDEAGLLGTVHLAPSWIFAGYDGVLAVDIGGSNIRAGIVALGSKKGNLSSTSVHASELWRHCDDKPKRAEAVERLVAMLQGLMKRADKDGLTLAPFIGVGCPGVIEEDGSISRGGQNLPGNWESSRFNLPAMLRDAIPKIGSHHTHVVMHNDAVVQGLSELPAMSDIEHWGVLTIGTGLGNARFTTRPVESTV
jgi:predicted NBD/HSP70 family sugar kinase